MNRKQTIRLNESQLKQIVTESIQKYLNETNTRDNLVYEFEIDTLELNGSHNGHSIIAKKANSSNEALLLIINDAIKNGFTIEEVSFLGSKPDFRQNGYRKELNY